MKYNLKEKLATEYQNFQASLGADADSHANTVRNGAFKRFRKSGFPTRKHEEWRFTDISFLEKHDFRLVSHMNAHSYTRGHIEQYLIHNLKVNLVVFLNGTFSRDLSDILEPELIDIKSLGRMEQDDPDFVRNYFTRAADDGDNTFISVNTAFAYNGIAIKIPRNAQLKRPIHILNYNDATRQDIMVQPRSLIHIGDNASVKIIESFSSIGHYKTFSNVVSELFLDPGAHADYYKVQDANAECFYISTMQAVQSRDSVFNATTVTLSGKVVRNNLHTLFNDENAEADFNGFYYCFKDHLTDNHTLADHAVPNCQSNELYKGILYDKSQAVFNGKVVVRKDAQHTNAYQTNRNILMSDDAKVNTKPQLEIYADDVKCSHGATSGNLDKEALFYLRTRGIGEDMAHALLLSAFAGEILEKISIAELRNEIKVLISKRLSVEDMYFCEFIDN